MPIKLAGLVLLLGAGVAGAQKTDSVWIRNGDRITGEVKSLSRGLLKYSTNDLGTINIEWDKVDRLSTTTVVEVRLASGEKYFGRLGLDSTGRVVVGADTLRLREIVKLTPIKGTFLSRLDGYLDLGLSYQKAHSALQFSTGTRVHIAAQRQDRARLPATRRARRRPRIHHDGGHGTVFPQHRWSTGRG
jgi:hypothetical protein